jgi:hypothetical protein
MALSTISTISIASLSNIQSNVIVLSAPQYESFVFPNSLLLGVGSITSHTFNYTGSNPYSGGQAWKVGSYLMMSKYNNSTNIAWCMFSYDSKFYMTGVQGGTNTQQTFNTSNSTVTTGSTLGYTRAAYNATTGIYQGGTGTGAQNVTTTYNTSLTSSGEYFEFKFAKSFVFQKMNISLGNSNLYGPRNIRLVGSSDGINWTQVHFLTYTATYTNAVMVELFDITTTNFSDYNNHRVIWESNNTGNVIVIRDCTITGLMKTY